MKVTVLFFASLREQIGVDEIQVQIPEGTSTDTLVEVLYQKLGGSAATLLQGDSVRMALNQEMLDGARVLHQDDEVAYFPRVTGG